MKEVDIDAVSIGHLRLGANSDWRLIFMVRLRLANYMMIGFFFMKFRDVIFVSVCCLLDLDPSRTRHIYMAVEVCKLRRVNHFILYSNMLFNKILLIHQWSSPIVWNLLILAPARFPMFNTDFTLWKPLHLVLTDRHWRYCLLDLACAVKN